MATLDVREVERQAVAYLAEQLGEAAPRFLTLEGEFDEQPLDGEAAAMVFSFELELGGGGPCPRERRKHYVVAGQTSPGYFPAYGWSSDEAYSVHVGTRFMLETRLHIVEPSLEPPVAKVSLHAALRQFGNGAEPQSEELAALFRIDDEAYFAVYRVRVRDREYYAFGGDCPPGFYEMSDRPPQAVLRLHLGSLIRREARSVGESAPNRAHDERDGR